MLGFTGTWQGHPVSVQGSGMGQPSAAIYVTELFKEYDVQSVIRVGSCGGLVGARRHPGRRHRVGRVHRLLDEPASASRASTTPRSPTSACSARPRTPPRPPTCRSGVHVGLIYSSDSFYAARPELLTPMVEHGVLAIEMEASALYTIAAGFGRRALCIATVSDHIVTGEETTSQEREQTFGDMVEIALARRRQLTWSRPSSSARSGRSSGNTVSPVRT